MPEITPESRRLAVGWVALSVTIGGGFLLPSLLIVCVLWPGATWPERCAFIAPLVLTSLPLLAAVRVGGRVIAHTRRWSSYPKAHWRRAVQTLWGSLAFMLIGATLATGGTAFAIFGRSSIASPAVWWIRFGDVIVFLGFFVSLSEVSCVLNRGQVVPYFERPVGGIDTFCHGQSLLRNLADLERLAEEIGVSPLSAFGWHDDMRGETVVWHDPAVGLKTVKALLTHLGGEDSRAARPGGHHGRSGTHRPCAGARGGRGMPVQSLIAVFGWNQRPGMGDPPRLVFLRRRGFPLDARRAALHSRSSVRVNGPRGGGGGAMAASWVRWAAVVGFCVVAHPAEAATKPLRAGAATSNITPWLGLSINGSMNDHAVAHVHDELHARALVLDDGESKLAFIVCDMCMIPREIVTAAKTRIQERTGIAPDHVLISATHAHSCPTAGAVFQSDPDPDYLKFLALRIADAASCAVRNLTPAKIGWGFGRNAQQVHNRRWFLKPGTVPPDPFGQRNDRVRMNPAPGSPDLVEPAGPIDPDVAVLYVRTHAGKPVALLANYSLHYVGGVGPGHASADYFGVFADRVKELLQADRQDPPFVGIMSNGTSGDINNVNVQPTEPVPALPPYGQIRKVADELAREAVRVALSVPVSDHITLDARAADLTLGVRKPNAEELTQAKTIVAQAKGPEMHTLPEIYARESILLTRMPDTVPVTIQALRIGDLGIVAIPCEVFVEIGLNLKAKSPLKPMFTIELANGYNGYLPTKAQHALGGYETWRARSSYLEVDAADKITAQALELLGELKAAKR